MKKYVSFMKKLMYKASVWLYILFPNCDYCWKCRNFLLLKYINCFAFGENMLHNFLRTFFICLHALWCYCEIHDNHLTANVLYLKLSSFGCVLPDNNRHPDCAHSNN